MGIAPTPFVIAAFATVERLDVRLTVMCWNSSWTATPRVAGSQRPRSVDGDDPICPPSTVNGCGKLSRRRLVGAYGWDAWVGSSARAAAARRVPTVSRSAGRDRKWRTNDAWTCSDAHSPAGCAIAPRGSV